MMEIILALIWLLTLSGMLWAFTKINHTRKELGQTKERLGSYLPPHVVTEVLARIDHRPMAMVYPEVTVVVFRIRHFANLIERLEPATALRYLNECYLLCGTAVHRNGGTIERLLEDGVVAVFGIGKDENSNHEYRGIRAGLEAARLVSAMGSRWENEGRRPLRISVGVNTGPIVAGDVGFGDRRAFALVGSTVNLAHQLQDICEEINAAVVSSASAYRTVESRFSALPVKQIPLRHVHEVRDTFIIRGLSPTEPNEELTLPTMPALMTTIEIAGANEFERPPPIARHVGSTRRVHPEIEEATFRENSTTAIVPEPYWPASYDDGTDPPTIHVGL